ncbi:MAG: dTMP kinase [Finegoldia sp.]|nr:dTMP kinase [Finegoldia sp.]
MFITFEGPDGSGKSTILKKVYDTLKAENIPVVKTREPGGTEISEKIRDIILDNSNIALSARAEALLYAASRAQLVDEFIRPNLEKGNIVLSDRFLLSSLAYQGYGRSLGVDKIRTINEFAVSEIKADIVLFFNISPDLTLERKAKEFKLDRLEEEDSDFHKRVYNGYMDLSKSEDNIYIIDASKSIGEVYRQCMEVIKGGIK